jgi:Mn2+/Fe2+ NRAMP family transporter
MLEYCLRFLAGGIAVSALAALGDTLRSKSFAAVMIVMMNMTARVEVMGKFTVKGGLRWLGWATTIVMGICVVVMGLTWVV